jgi:di/tricarboxylate transporter
VLAIVVLAPRLLPERASLASLMPAERKARFVTELVLTENTPLVGLRVGDVFDPEAPVRLLEMIRGEEIILAPKAGNHVLAPDDAMIVEGSPQEITAFLSKFAGFELASVVEDEQRVPMRTLQLKLVEAVVLPESPFAGRFVRDLGLNRLYGVKVMAVQRHGRQHRYQIRAMRLHPGDVLLLQSDDHGLAALREQGAVLIVEGVEQTVYRRRKMPIAGAIMAAVVLAAAAGLPLVVAALLGAALMLITRCVRVDEAVRSLDSATLLLLAGTIPLGLAMLQTGLAPLIVRGVVGLAGDSQAWLLLSLLYLVTAVLTSFLSNNAAAVLLTPIAIDMAATLNVDVRPLLMAIALGASACFSTPIGYQTNAIVMGPGGYTFGDYLRIGVPLTLVMWIAATVLIPVFWPLALP